MSERCGLSNGTYTCRFEDGHEGPHVARFRSAGEWRLAIFTNKYSRVEVVRSSVQDNVR